MSHAALQILSDRVVALRQAMDSQDAENIEKALAQTVPAIDAVRAHGAWRSDDALRSTLAALIKQLEAGRTVARLMSDLTRRQLDLLSAGAIDQAPVGYSRQG